jgi:RNA polymerase sigma-70 factor (ECF subfamily)
VLEASWAYLQVIVNTELASVRLSRLLRKELAACDLAQETFLAAHRSLPAFHGRSPHQVRAWLRQILRRRLASALRKMLAAKRDSRRELSLDLYTRDGETGCEREHRLAADTPSPHEEAVMREQVAHLQAALARLPELYRQVIGLRCYEGRAFADIGRSLNTSAEAARKLWTRALDRLRRTSSHLRVQKQGVFRGPLRDGCALRASPQGRRWRVGPGPAGGAGRAHSGPRPRRTTWTAGFLGQVPSEDRTQFPDHL